MTLPLAQTFRILKAQRKVCVTGHCALLGITSSHPSSIRPSPPIRRAVARMPPSQGTAPHQLPQKCHWGRNCSGPSRHSTSMCLVPKPTQEPRPGTPAIQPMTKYLRDAHPKTEINIKRTTGQGAAKGMECGGLLRKEESERLLEEEHATSGRIRTETGKETAPLPRGPL